MFEEIIDFMFFENLNNLEIYLELKHAYLFLSCQNKSKTGYSVLETYWVMDSEEPRRLKHSDV